MVSQMCNMEKSMLFSAYSLSLSSNKLAYAFYATL